MTQMLHHEEAADAKEAFLEQFKSAYDEGRWMAVAVRVAQNGTLTVMRTTFQFPHDQIDAAVALLQRDLEKDKGGRKPSPLPFAPLVQRIPLGLRDVGITPRGMEQPQEHHTNGEAVDQYGERLLENLDDVIATDEQPEDENGLVL